MEEIWTLRRLVEWGREYFDKKGIDSPRLTIELMLSNLLSIKRIDIYTQYDKPVTSSELAILKEWVLRRVRREPLQYILGKTWFLGFVFEVDKRVLIPRPETELLVQEALKALNNHPTGKILDIGTGSGCIAITLAKYFPAYEIHAIDFSEDALNVARRNAEMHDVKNIIFNKIDILKDLPGRGKYDLVISNPPYIEYKVYKKLEPEVLEFEPVLALTDKKEGLEFYQRYAAILPGLLSKDGEFLFEFGFGQLESLRKIFSENYYQINSIKDFSGIDRILTGKYINQKAFD